MSTKPAVPQQFVRLQCDCETKGGQYLNHYDLVRCSCGRMFWALQPQRGGRLVAFPWPGLPKREAA